MFWLSNEPNAPLHSDMIAILIGVPEPPLRGATAGWGAGASAGAAAAGVLVDAAGVLAALLLVLLSLLDPHPAMAKASTAMVTASQIAPRPECRATGMYVSPPRNGYLVNPRVLALPTPFPG
jgi:glycine/D-amino acid oxidase-like deaminating enzyme